MKKWSIAVIISFVVGILIIGGMTYIVDPYFHFHHPIDGIAYQLDKYNYINDGIARNFEFDTIVTGTSLTEHFRTEDIDDIFGAKSVRLTFLGEGNKRIDFNTSKCLKLHDIKTVIRGLDTMYFISDSDFEKYDQYPEYLYDENLINDVKYLLNIDVFVGDTIPTLARTISGKKMAKFDDITSLDGVGLGKAILKDYQRAEKVDTVLTDSDYDEYIARLIDNLNENVIATIKDNPNTTFYIFFPPYSILYFDELHQNGEDVLNRRFELEKVAIEMLLEHDNVKLFSFFDDFSLISDLDYYVDSCHYIPKINRELLVHMAQDEYRLTKENYMDYLDRIREFYLNYNYDMIYECK